MNFVSYLIIWDDAPFLPQPLPTLQLQVITPATARNVVLFPEKLAKANEQLKKSGFPKLPNKKHSR